LLTIYAIDSNKLWSLIAKRHPKQPNQKILLMWGPLSYQICYLKEIMEPGAHESLTGTSRGVGRGRVANQKKMGFVQ